ncbi:GPP34 family phosphoprotein [Actinoplanes oblitus]|uniref:GPP34 family phosphoprotein n=1 Tax=Actinoplanes oblitus TaxID=3040509 RepID=A0ABY8WHA6_9ACTN|nr:GPP34 family phosphoprotein [Actinoplanes oblitus]WIM95744.1 GPP34 family phosphoprotein [Actinoplanes oblitus]
MVRRISSLREKVWLLAHDEQNDLRPLIDVRALGIGLAAATLTDLLLQDRIYVKHGLIHTNRERTGPAADPIATDILAAITEEPAPRIAEVVRGARVDLVDDGNNPYQRLHERTLAGLVAGGHLLEQHRRLRSTRYQLADSHLVTSIRADLRSQLVRHPRGKCDPAMDCLCALVLSLNLHSTMVFPFSTEEAEPILLDITGRIPARAGKDAPLTILPHLVQVVRYAVGDLATAAF